MSGKLGKQAYGQHEHQQFLGRDLMQHKDYSDETASKIDQEVQNLVDSAYKRAKDLLTKNRDKMDLLAKRLVEKEVIDIDETRTMLGITEIKPAGSDAPVNQPQPPSVN